MEQLKNSKAYQVGKKVFIAMMYGLLSAIGVNTFLAHAHSYSDGITGISQLVQALLATQNVHVSMSFLVFILNLPLLLFGWREFGLNYISYSSLAILFNVIFFRLIPVKGIVNDPLTNSIIGGALIGLSVGLCFNNGFTSGGTDILVTFFQVRYNKKIGFLNTVIGATILTVTAICFGLSRFVYSVIAVLVGSYLMDYIFVWQKDITVSIYTKQPDKVTKVLKHLIHGATMVKATGVYTNEPTTIILIVAQKGFFNSLKALVDSVDPQAFITVSPTSTESANYDRYTLGAASVTVDDDENTDQKEDGGSDHD